jgi:aryl-phospho-beta-D-glucosidase BglC (GH1 family)
MMPDEAKQSEDKAYEYIRASNVGQQWRWVIGGLFGANARIDSLKAEIKKLEAAISDIQADMTAPTRHNDNPVKTKVFNSR